MFCSRKMNNKINQLQERCLCIVYSDKKSSFEKLLETDRSVPIHIRNLWILAAGLSKEIKDLTPTIFSEFFSKCKVFSMTCVTVLSSLFQTWQALFIVTEILFYLAPKIWTLIPKELKDLSSLGALKNAIKKWKPRNFLC